MFVANFISLYCRDISSLSGRDGSHLVFGWDPLDVIWILNREVFVANFISLCLQDISLLSGCDGLCLVFGWDPVDVFWIALDELMLICERKL